MSAATAASDQNTFQSPLLKAALVVALALMSVFILMAGRPVLVPFAVSILLWFIINALSRFLHEKVVIGSFQLPSWASLTASLLIVLAACVAIAEMVIGNVQAMTERAPLYLKNVEALSAKLAVMFGSDTMEHVTTAVEGIDLEAIVLSLANGAAALLSSAGAVILYVAFLLVEQQFLGKKLAAIAETESRGAKISRVMDDIGKRVRTYLFTKSLTSAAMAGVVWVFLEFAGVDFAGFWVFLVFVLNFIPVVGGIVSGVFPALLALVQFPDFTPFLIVVAGVATAHLVIGNIVEPRFVGSSVNLSPLIVILALAVWGFIWGIPGMFLCVPLTVIAMIIFGEFKATRSVAIALSENGEIGPDESETFDKEAIQ